MATHSSILAWKIPMDRGAWQATFHGVAQSRTEQLSMQACKHRMHMSNSQPPVCDWAGRWGLQRGRLKVVIQRGLIQ